jgi:hypothetical protein
LKYRLLRISASTWPCSTAVRRPNVSNPARRRRVTEALPEMVTMTGGGA